MIYQLYLKAFLRGGFLIKLSYLKGMRNILASIFTSLLLLTSCASYYYNKLDAKIEPWQGQKEDQVYLIYGPPSRTQELSDGRKIITYDYTRSRNGNLYTGAIIFGITDGVVTTAKYQDANAVLQYRIKAPDHKPIID